MMTRPNPTAEPKDTRTRYITIHRLCPPHIQKALKLALIEFDGIEFDIYRGNTTVLSEPKP